MKLLSEFLITILFFFYTAPLLAQVITQDDGTVLIGDSESDFSSDPEKHGDFQIKNNNAYKILDNDE
jgi:hypothetical protein